jgi:hypothetical protein
MIFFYKPFYVKESVLGYCHLKKLIWKRERERYLVDKLIHGSVPSHYDYGGLGSLHDAVHGISSCMKIPEV